MEPISHDRLAGISAYVAAVDAGSFAQAAIRLGLTRSAVSKAVARLEARLGARLFVRSTRSLRLTDEGQMFYERCAGALQALETAQHLVEAGVREPMGRLRISAPVVFGRHYIAPLLIDLAERHPLLQVEGNFTDRTVDFIEDGIDLAIRSGELPDTDTLVARLLGMQAMIVCAAPAYLATHGTPRTVADLSSHRHILYRRGNSMAAWPLAEEGKISRERPKYAVAFDDVDAIAMAARRGAGIAYLPLWCVRNALADGTLVSVLEKAATERTPLHAVWPRTQYMPYSLRVTIDTLLAALPPLLAPHAG